MRCTPVLGLLLAFAASVPTSGLSQSTTPAAAAARAGNPAAGLAAPTAELDPERVVNTNDSLAFSPDLTPPQTRVAMNQGAGVVRSILESSFGQTALAAVLFDRRVILYLLLALGAGVLELLYRRGARGLVELPTPALGLSGGRTLPIVGEDHPVGRLSVRFSQRAAGIAILLHLLLLWTWLVARDLPQPLAAVVVLDPGQVRVLQPPPDIVSDPEVPLGGRLDITGFQSGVPEPVAELLPPDQTIAPFDDFGFLYEEGAGSGGGGERAEGAVEEGTFIPRALERHVEHVPFDPGVVPVLLHMPTPSYPEIARTAEVQGTVMLQILVGVDGGVADVRILRGHPMLNEAAMRAARGARFRPATQQHRPVAVWVEFPVRFSLY